MNLATLTALSFGISIDAFAVSLARAAQYQQKQGTILFIYVLKTGFIFGIVEALTPIFGYFIGVLAKNVVQDYDHWVSFILLSFLGMYAIYEALFQSDSQKSETEKNGIWKMALAAVATSIDAMIIGVSLAFLEINIWLASAMIGICTTLMVGVGAYLGFKLGAKLGKLAEILGGVVLIGIGSIILFGHLTENSII